MEVQGKIIQKLPLQSGTSKMGNPWSKQVYILETLDSFPKKVAFDFFGDRINQYDAVCAVGATITLSYDIESREYQGRWYTDILGWKAEPFDPTAAQQMPPATPYGAPAPAAPGYAPAPAAPTAPGYAPAPAPADGAPVPAPDPAALGFAQDDGAQDELPF